MFKIGEFSRIASVTIDTLRHYDALGLLKPAKVDSNTGYRYYITTQLETLNRIIVLKEIGFSLEEIVHILREEPTQDEFRGMLKAQLAIAESELESVQLRRARILSRLNHLDQDLNVPHFNVTLKSVNSLTIASIRETVPTSEKVAARWGQMFTAIGAWLGANAIQSGPAMTIYHNEGYCDENIDTECAFVLRTSAPHKVPQPEALISIRKIEAVPQMATIVVADYRVEGLMPAYQALGQWVGEHGYHIIGAPRELYYGSPADNDFTAEIQFPVT
ncbi:MAG: MerR family transcriptional regulator [Chloroflexota bacterium]